MPFPGVTEALQKAGVPVAGSTPRQASTRQWDKSQNPRGGTSITTHEAETIFERLEAGQSLASILAEPNMPGHSSWYRAMEKDAGMRERYARACAARADGNLERVQSIISDLTDPGKDRTSNEINAMRAAVDAIKWHNAVTNPHKYAPKSAVEHSGKVDTGNDRDPRELAKAVLAALGASALTGARMLQDDADSPTDG